MAALRVSLAVFALVLTLTGVASAENLIRSDTSHPSYFFEAEPHFVVTPFHDGGVGAGFAGTFNIADRGFINRFNDSVGVGFAANWTNSEHFILSAAMQWNFWFTEHWSAFGEPGFAIGTRDDIVFWPAFGAGGRYAFNESIALTLRVGFPATSIGVSFFL